MLDIKFELKAKVKIIELDRIGVVIGQYNSDTGIQYQVRYFYEGEVKTVYFYEDELIDG